MMLGAHIGLCHRNRLFGECLAAALNDTGDLNCRMLFPDAFASSLPAAVADPLEFDLVLLDAALADNLTCRIVDELRRRAPACKLLLIIAEGSVEHMVEYARLGSQGCLFEEVSLSEVRQAIQVVLAGRPFCSPQLANSLLAQLGRIDPRESWSKHLDAIQLTAREREILTLIAWDKLCNKQIARRLNVSLYTIKNHVHNIIEKLGAADRHEAAELARSRKLLTSQTSEAPETGRPRLPR